jgi:Asp-tRNA(Asn)/Glu-tRNA(Gln) amidotransferase C subunit
MESKIQNSHLLTGIFGRWPSFHDAEVLRITLDRGESGSFEPSLEAVIHVFEMTSEVDDKGYYLLKNHVAVCFRFREIVNLSLEGFNQQNVLQHLAIDHLSDREQDKVKFKVVFEGIFGVEAEFHCESISIESVEPYAREQS